MERCNLHTVLRLPAGIFYAAGVKTNVLFFTRGQRNRGNTRGVWFYDLRTDMPQFGKRTTLEREHFAGFEAAYGTDPFVRPASLRQREASGESERFYYISREEIVKRDENLDVVSSHAGKELLDDTPELAGVVHQARSELQGALDEIRLILAELGELIEV
jgi:type I restriction enzyme M protein